MAETIRNEVKKNIKMALDLDNLRSRYVDIDDTNSIEVIFPAGDIFSYEQNFFTLLAKSKKVTMQPKWEQRPDYVSKHFYNTEIFWNLILYINQIDSIEDFRNINEIFIPPFNDIIKLTKYKVSKSEVTEITKDIPKLASFLKVFPLDEKEINKIKLEESPPTLEPEPDDSSSDGECCIPSAESTEECFLDGGIF